MSLRESLPFVCCPDRLIHPPLAKSNIVTLKVPSYRESLRNLEKTQRRPSSIAPAPVQTGTFTKGSKILKLRRRQSTYFMLLKTKAAPMELSTCRWNVTSLGFWRTQIQTQLFTEVFSTICELMMVVIDRKLIEITETLPVKVTRFECSDLYNTGACMWGCSGPPPGTGCPICNPVDLQGPLRSSQPQWDRTR